MPPKKTNNKPSTSRASAMADCKIPGDVMLCILTCLPVKSLCRFKCVCKPWLALFSSPDFVTRHRDVTASNPENHSFVIHSVSEYHDHVTSFLNVSSAVGGAVKVTHPFPELFFRMDLVGACNGLVSLACPPLGQMIVLWNPATRHWKAIRLSYKTHENPLMISLGLGFDSASSDFKVVRIECLPPKGLTPDQCLQVRANVYSANTDSWKRVKLGFKFHVTSTRNDGIVGGVPYWRAFVKDLGDESGFGEVFVRFDVKNGVFDRIPGPKLDVDFTSTTVLVEWKSCLAILVYSPKKEKKLMDVVVFDELQRTWTTKLTIGPIGIPFTRQIQCTKGGKILLENPEGKLLLFDHNTNRVIKEVSIEDARRLSYEAFNYTESLVHLKNMELVTKIEGQFDFELDPAEEEEMLSGFCSVLSFA